MSRLDGILKDLGGAPDDVDNLAAKVGVDPALAEMAIRLLSETHQMGGDTVTLAAARTGIEPSVLREIVDQIGGEGSLGHFTMALSHDGERSAAKPATDLATGLFGKR